MAGATKWAVRCAASLLALVVLSFGGWTHQSSEAQYIDASSTLPTGNAAQTSKTAAASADPTPAAAAAAAATSSTATTPTWWSGASSTKAANGTYGRWRGEALTVGGTWDNGNKDMVVMKSICPGGGEWAKWNKPLDVAIGAIETTKGESWAKAATGAYDARWRKSLLRMKTCWGSRDPANLYIRFAHEFNIKNMPWKVLGGQEADFVKAQIRFSDLRYQILPKAKLVMCPSDGTSGDQKIDLHKVWPGKDSQGRQVINIYAVDTYNSWVVVRTREEFINKLSATQSGMPLGIEAHRMLAVGWGVPFAVSEWSGNGDPKDEGTGADLPIYYQLMNQWFREHAADPKNPQPGQLLYEIQFNYEPRFQLLPTTVQPKSAKAYRALMWGK